VAGSDVSSGGLRPYMPQLDGVRACAVFMVFVSHWIPWSYQGGFPWNNFGVDLFFVLSGFLITDILLHGRRYLEEGEQGLFLTLRQFYVRRALRICPLYFVFLIGYALTAPTLVNELTPWLWTYTLNLFRVLIDHNWEGPISHLWSLSIEEQFYLVWPWVILLTPRRFLLPVLLLSVAIGPTAKVILGLNEVSERAIRFFTLSRMDTLALGGLLAYAVHRHGLLPISQSRLPGWLFWAGLPVFCVVVGLRAVGIGSTNWMILELSAETLLCGWVVLRAAQGFPGLLGRFLASAPLVYLGQISYGLYLLHKPIPSILQAYGIDTNGIPAGIGFFLYAVLAILAASISWYLLERPINRLKRNFPYRVNGVVSVCEPAFARGIRE